MVWNLRGAVLVGNQAPDTKALYKRMSHPRVGDLVVEVTTWRNRDDESTMIRAGQLVRMGREPMFTKEVWEAEHAPEPAPPIPDEMVYYIRVGDGRECRWVNASFYAAPTKMISSLHPLDDAFVFTEECAAVSLNSSPAQQKEKP